jgi:hypothetical protein
MGEMVERLVEEVPVQMVTAELVLPVVPAQVHMPEDLWEVKTRWLLQMCTQQGFLPLPRLLVQQVVLVV